MKLHLMQAPDDSNSGYNEDHAEFWFRVLTVGVDRRVPFDHALVGSLNAMFEFHNVRSLN